MIDPCGAVAPFLPPWPCYWPSRRWRRLSGPRGTTAELSMSWNDLGRHPRAIVTGQAGGALLAATLPAP